MSADIINSFFEASVSAFVWLNVRRLYVDKRVKGASLWAACWFCIAGCWRSYFYVSIGVWWSFVSGASILAANLTWFFMALYYTRRRAAA